MKFRNLAGTDIKISEICLGTWVFGGNMWSGTDEQDCIKTVDKALDMGINIIDTAAVYGFGKSEEILGTALEKKRKNIIIATKCGLVWEHKKIRKCLKPDSIKKEIDRSLTRLKTDYIDIYQIHWPDENTPLEDTFDALKTIKQSGKIRHIGVCNFNLELLKKAFRIGEVVSVQNEYSYLKPGAGNSVFDFCRTNKISFFAYGPLAGGILSGKYKKAAHFAKNDARSFFYKFYKGEGFEKAQKAIKLLETISDKRKVPLSQVAINWILSNPAVTSVLTGARTPEQIETNALSSLWQLTKVELDLLK